ncbi:discoidin domain-containing protein [Paenibacillus glycanilyticus]|uniref:discoidin domain-containing protein n=1 Tax=Paenibacillus glycanilyticus TaxID=126569 RepID=UPI00203EA6BD|nr:discoidin domain-containing protein [Paenibacillus glycanilyticus]MCM3629784.1 discoidin domain-containing protein [Paenibacillus glycanilyticus]
MFAAMRKKRLRWFHAITAILVLLGSVPLLSGLQVQAAEAESNLLSMNRSIYASSSLGGNTPDLAVDGDVNSRWESVWKKDPQWIYVDLGAAASLSKVVVNWENAYSNAYTIQVSDDEESWQDLTPIIQGKPGEIAISVSGTGRYVRLFSYERALQPYGISIREFSVYGSGGLGGPPQPAAPNLALNHPVTVSSLEIDEPSKSAEDKAKMKEINYLANNATDGNKDSRWSSIYKDKEWLYVDLGQISEIGSVSMNWEAAFGRAYDIQVSDDATHWTTIYRQLNGNGGKETIPVYAKARYVKLAGIARGSYNGYSLFEFEVRAYREGDPKPAHEIPAIPNATAVQVGAGSYEQNDITQLEPKNPTYRTSNITSPIPSNDWWQSILVSNLGDGNSLITLPLKNWYTKQGLAVLNPGAGFPHGDSIDADGDPDLYLTSNNMNPANMETKISGYGDYSASVILSDDDTSKMRTTFVKGSPFLYNAYENPDAVTLQSPAMTRLFDDNNNPVLVNDGDVYTADHIGLEVTNKDKAPTPQTFVRHYGIFVPEGTTFRKLGNTIKIKLGSGEDYLSLAVLPSADELGMYYQHAYAFVTDTKVDYHFDEQTSMVTTNFKTSTELKRPGFSPDTIMTMLPHQWKISDTPLTDLSYPSIRGTMKVTVGNSFTTSDRFNGLIPQFVEPNDPTYSRAQLVAYLDQLDADVAKGVMVDDPYWQGKKLHPLALAVLISDQLGDSERRDRYLASLRTILTDWYTYTPEEKLHAYYFHYSDYWGSLMAYHSGFGLNTGLTDHHFTYGYYIFASAVLATYDKEFQRDYGGMVETLIRDYANPSRTDAQFPWFRNFDPYEGHSWAGGYADNHSGNNQEAAGESLFGWVGEYMWGLVTDNDTYRDAGIWGFTTEEKAVEQYWFNYDGDNWVEGYNHATAGQVYGSATAFTTFFNGDPEYVYGIHWLPPAEWMTYYGRQPEKAAALYEGLISEIDGGQERAWYHIIWPFESISDPEAVLNKWDTTHIQQNEAFNAYWFVHSMASLGHRSADIWADDPAVTVYEKDGVYTAQIWNPSESAKTIHFFNQDGAAGSATVYANALVSVNPLKNTVLDGPDPSQGIKYLDRSAWEIKASKTGESLKHLTDSDLSTRWSSGKTQAAGDWLQLDLGAEQSFDTLFMNSGMNWNDYAHGYDVYVSKNGEDWGEPVASGNGTSPSIAVSLPEQKARFVKIVLTEDNNSWWSISEVKIAQFGKPSAEAPTDITGPLDRSVWTVTASSTQGNDAAANMLDGDHNTRWTTGQNQRSGDWLQLDLGEAKSFDTVTLSSGSSASDYMRGYQLFVSADGEHWGTAVAGDIGEAGTTIISLPVQHARYIRIVQIGDADKWWSIAELNAFNYGIGKQKPLEPGNWTVTASSTAGGESAQAMLDGNPDTRWSTGSEQKNGDYIKLDLGADQTFNQVVLDSGRSYEDYMKGYEVYASDDGESWGQPVASGAGTGPLVMITFPQQQARYMKVKQTGVDPHWWSISELRLFTSDHLLND